MTGWWLSERQLPNGGLNGRPEKLEDVSTSLPTSASSVEIIIERAWNRYVIHGGI